MKILVEKSNLIGILKGNRHKHRDLFERAVEGYRKKCVDFLNQRLGQIKAGEKPNMFFTHSAPIDQTADYDRVIGLLEMAVSDNVELSESDYSCYVLDKWDWADRVMTLNSSYVGSER